MDDARTKMVDKHLVPVSFFGGSATSSMFRAISHNTLKNGPHRSQNKQAVNYKSNVR